MLLFIFAVETTFTFHYLSRKMTQPTVRSKDWLKSEKPCGIFSQFQSKDLKPTNGYSSEFKFMSKYEMFEPTK